MIYTVTLNPSLDYIMFMSDPALGELNRSQRESIYPGGKGINVSIMLARLGLECRVLGYLSGFTGRAVEEMLAGESCRTDFVFLDNGFTRINVKIKAEQESEFNGGGPVIGKAEQDALLSKLDTLGEGDTLVLAGSIPPSLPADIYGRILGRLEGKRVRCVVDVPGNLLKSTLSYRPFLIKPNAEELGELFGVKINSSQDVITYGKKAQEMGASNVLVSLGKEGAMLLAEDGSIFSQQPPEGKVVNSVGAGDSMVAGFLAGLERSGDLQKALRMGIAAGSATAFAEWLATVGEVAALMARKLN